MVSGSLGGSILGRHLAVTPRCREALAIAERFEVHAAIDISDGLSLDTARLMQASGAAAMLDLASIPIHADARRMATRPGDRASPLEHALADGEDFELLLALPPDEARRLVAEAPSLLGVPFTAIGEVVAGAGLLARAADGTTQPLTPQGYVHAFDG